MATARTIDRRDSVVGYDSRDAEYRRRTCDAEDKRELIRERKAETLKGCTRKQNVLLQGCNHVFKDGGPIPWSRLLYRTKYGWYTQFRALLRKKSGWSIQLFWRGSEPPTPPPSGCALVLLCSFTGHHLIFYRHTTIASSVRTRATQTDNRRRKDACLSTWYSGVVSIEHYITPDVSFRTC